MAVRTNVRLVLESVTLADVVSQRLPPQVQALVDAYEREQPDGAVPAARRDLPDLFVNQCVDDQCGH